MGILPRFEAMGQVCHGRFPVRRGQTKVTTDFEQLNHGSSAEPNAPEAAISVDGADLKVQGFPNPNQFPAYADVTAIEE